jgi:hypothetical protein
MSKQQTAIDWLWQQIFDNHVHELEDLAEFFQQAKKMECEQIAKAWERRAMDVTGYDYYRLYHGELPYGGDHE